MVQTERFTGRVKWFNKRAGYGFITQTSGDNSGKDVFVHHSSIVVSKEQFRYLVEGEYVTFSIDSLDDVSENKYLTHAIDVHGVDEGVLMCVINNTQKKTKTHHKNRKGKGKVRSGKRKKQSESVVTVDTEDGVLTLRLEKPE